MSSIDQSVPSESVVSHSESNPFEEKDSVENGLDLELPEPKIVEENINQPHFWQEESKISPSGLPEADQAVKAVELSIWLHTEFQHEMEDYQVMTDKVAEDESKPFDYKYKAREMLLKLMTNPYLDPQIKQEQQSQVVSCANALVFHKLGVNYSDCEEYHEGEQYLNKALECFNQVSDNLKVRFFNTIQDIYNNIGIIYCNREAHEKGAPYFEKAEEIYNLVQQSGEVSKSHNTSILNDFDQYLLNQIEQESASRKQMPQVQDFAFYISGGIDQAKLEKNLTLTLFYKAQMYTKLGKNDEAVHYCAETMKRQLTFKEYDAKDWAVNCINLSEYFIKNGHFAQGEYCLFAGLQILPSDLSKKKKLRATFQMQLARYYLERLKFGVNNFIQNKEQIPEVVHKKFVEFPELLIKFPEIKDINNIEQAKLLFRLSNTQFKKALDFFVLDGFVTEHIQMKQELSKLYKNLSMIEDNNQRVFAMLERRKELLEPILAEINPKAYEVNVQEIGVELSDIYASMFDIQYDSIKEAQKVPKKKDLEDMNALGNKSIQYSNQILDLLMSKDNEEKNEFAQAILNLSLSVARIFSKLFDKQKSIQIKYLESSYKQYEKLIKFMKEYMAFKSILKVDDLPQGMREQYKMSLEMFELLPLKITKLNAQK